jgi:hypothetical protein
VLDLDETPQLSAYIPQNGFGQFMYNSKRHPLWE